jgi:hypothetical protein
MPEYVKDCDADGNPMTTAPAESTRAVVAAAFTSFAAELEELATDTFSADEARVYERIARRARYVADAAGGLRS